MSESIWKTWSEILELSKGRDVVLYGRSEDWLPKTIRKVKNIEYIVDRNPKYKDTKFQNINVYSPDKLLADWNNQNEFIIITASIYYEIVEILTKNNLIPGLDFCCCPEFKDYSNLENIKNLDKNILVSSSDYVNRDRVRSSRNGGGLYKYSLKESQYELKVAGVYRQISKIGDNFFAVEYQKGQIDIFDKGYQLLDSIKLDGANYCGIAYCDTKNIIAVVNAGTDTISLFDVKSLSQIDKINFSKSKDYKTTSNYHLNDCCIANEKLYVTMFSLSGRWKSGIFDGSLVEYDLNNFKDNPIVLVNNAWMPHSPEFIDGEICYLDSMRGNLITSNQYVTAHFDYFARGLDGDGRYYIIGASENMYASRIVDSAGKNTIMANAGFSIFDRSTNVSRFHSFMNNMNIHDLMFL